MGMSNLKQIARAMTMYQEDNDGRFPPKMMTTDNLVGSLGIYCKDEQIFRMTHNPDEGEFVGNGLLAGSKAEWLYEQETTISVYESKIWKETGLRNVGFVDGHVEFVDEDDFNYGLKVERLFADPPE